MKTETALTKSVKEAAALADLLTVAESAAIGELTGETGSGKSAAGKWLAETRPNAARVVLYDGIGRNAALAAVARAALGQDDIGPASGRMDRLAANAAGKLEAGARPLLVVDECNVASWRILELLRYLADECGYAVLLIGHELYSRKFADAKTQPLLRQLGRRIGAKRVAFGRLDRAQTYLHIVKPRFGEAPMDVATEFWTAGGRGNWGESIELADACRRVMTVNKRESLDKDVLASAISMIAQSKGQEVRK